MEGQLISEKRYLAQFCPYCATPLSSQIKYCETCGAEIVWSISEYQVPPYPWSPKSAYLITIIAFGLSLVLTVALLLYYIIFFGISLSVIALLLGLDPLFTFLLTLGELVFILIPWAYVTRLKVGREKLGVTSGGPKTLSKDVVLGLVVGVLMVPLILLLDLYEILSPGYGPPPIPPGPTDVFWVGMLCLSIVFVVAPAEEVLFRGFVQNSLDAHYGRIGGLLVASIMFGFAHLNPLIGVIHTLGGLVLGLLFQWRGRRLAGPITAHATYDCLIILLDAFFI